MSRTDTRVSRKTFDTACDNVFKLRQQNAALLEALEKCTTAMAQAIELSRQHDPATGYYKPVDPYQLQQILHTKLAKARAAIAAATGEGN